MLLGENFRVTRGGSAQPLQGIGAPSELLKDRVVWNGTQAFSRSSAAPDLAAGDGKF